MDAAVHDYEAGRTHLAEASCRSVLKQNPLQADALHLMAVMSCDRGDAVSALRLLDRAIGASGGRAILHNTRARALIGLGRPAEAEAEYRLAWSLRPGTAEIANNLACLLRDTGELATAIVWFQTARELDPCSPSIACNLAGALTARCDFDAALAQFKRALRLRPQCSDIHRRCGEMFLAWGRPECAEQMYRAALDLRPGHAPSLNDLGLALQAQGFGDAARRSFAEALVCDPDFADAHYNLGCLLLLENRQDAARACHDRALAASPLHGLALWGRCMAELPVLYDTAEQVALQRRRYSDQLGKLEAHAANPAAARALALAAGASQPFFLPYQGACDRDLQARYGALMARLLCRADVPPAIPSTPGEPLRLAIVSGFFREHTIWRLMLKGWLAHLDRNRFEVTAYHTSAIEDAQTAIARLHCPGFVTGSERDVRKAILAARPHVLLYPEIGMDRVAARLSAERLAPLQCVAWGQPQTTGLPEIDIFFSSESMEPATAAAHYTERLVPLPNLGIHYDFDEREAESCTRAELGVRPGSRLFWCGQALSKYHPEHDDVFVRIAAASGDCQFLFIGFAPSRAVTEQFRARLTAAFARRGLEPGRHILIVEPMSQERFLGTIRLADVVLDSIGWSGGKSTLDMLAEAPVIVTLAGAMLRGRHTAAILTGIGVTETIAAHVDEYVAIAVRMGRDSAERNAVRSRMKAGRHRVIGDLAPIRAMEDAMTNSAGGLVVA